MQPLRHECMMSNKIRLDHDLLGSDNHVPTEPVAG